jgi:glycosyltransferase involved in cell wall biosynthesis
MPYNIPVLNALTQLGFKITVIHKIKKSKTSYDPPHIDQVDFMDEAEFNKKELKEFTLKFQPDLVFVCDWSMQKYNACAGYLRKRLNIPVVVGCDTQWTGGKQWANVFTSKLRHHRYFSHILVAGVRQFEYAKKIGFRNHQIIMNLYSADVEKFNNLEIEPNKFEAPRNFLFVGRFVDVKGIRQLLSAWRSIDEKRGSTLTLIGEGALKNELQFPDDVNIYPFMSQDELLQHAKSSCCFILPSIFEPWALVIHEFAAAGLPLIVTDACGAAPHFVINNYNGFVVPPGSTIALKRAIETVIGTTDQELLEFANRSRRLSRKISPEIVAHSLISVL